MHVIFVKANMSTGNIFPAVSCCGTTPLPRLKNAEQLAAVYRALADETRLRILSLLGSSEVCVCHIHGGLRLPQPTISRHLAYLRRSGLVKARRDGVWMHYRLATDLSPVVQQVLDSALHALTHAEITSQDALRVQKERAAG
jgi:ArsR family transcriptional regulator, arsenate/arsenite/antimonite-responsive transcriptional repressor